MTPSILLFGGRSDERLVSVASGQNLAASYPFDELWFLHPHGPVSRTTAEELKAHQRPFEVAFAPSSAPFASSIEAALDFLGNRAVFIGLHGTEGEDGTLQRLFEDRHIAFTGSGSRSSHDCFDKLRAKEIARQAGVPVAAGVFFEVAQAGSAASDEAARKTEGARLERLLSDLMSQHGKLVVKPTESGSSFGLHIMTSKTMVQPTVQALLESPYLGYLAEAFVEGRELTVGVMEENGKLRFIAPSEVVLNAGHSFDYQGKYLGRGTTEITPADLNPEEMQKAGELAILAHQALGCFGYSRTDMILTQTGPVFLETNTLPGMTRASFIPQQLTAIQWDIRRFLDLQLDLAVQRQRRSRTASTRAGASEASNPTET